LSFHVHGRNNSHILHYLTGRSLRSSELDELTQGKESLYRSLCLAQGALFTLSPGAEELLDLLAAKNIPRTIATSSERTNLDFFIAHFKLGRWFDVQRIVYDDGSFPGKPAPDMYLRAAGQSWLAAPRMRRYRRCYFRLEVCARGRHWVHCCAPFSVPPWNTRGMRRGDDSYRNA